MKAFDFTADQRQFVKQETAFGATQKEIAKVMGCTVKTLRKHCSQELQGGKGWANRAVAKSLFWSATVGKNVTAQIWWEKTRAGMHEKLAHEHSVATPPKLGISFEAGGPGLQRREAYSMEKDPHLNWPSGADRLDGPPEHFEKPAQEYIPRSEAPQPSPISRNLPALEPVRGHEHKPLMDSPCAKCRMLGVQLSMRELASG